ncbi:hypothetical protein [Criblamydia sequanensis]|uniref:Uncharacterized protein n=1 Tax=Candidatus Criblamydia sequanensis CRIB-18 TaxID=1437425 RepID=A0A090D309_9BACT|nr:hypothetical protein [Criblamydia sequanensis]CDR34813.1 Conserved hypothetical protein [Criblamydia sequanensis CRIB-18]
MSESLKHPNFIFQPSTWLGEGKISFSTSPEEIRYYSKWMIDPMVEGRITIRQIVEMDGVEDHVENEFVVSNIKEGRFNIEISNESIGIVPGKGVYETDKIAWEFQGELFHGFEVYHAKSKDEYALHAEYSSEDFFRTIIKGRIWLKS